MQSTKDSVAPAEQKSGSRVLLTSGNTLSDKVLALASPRNSRVGLGWDLRGTIPGIGTVWYLLGAWPFHLYLEYSCIAELHSQTEVQIITAVQVLLTSSLLAMLLFSVSFFLKMDYQRTYPAVGAPGCNKHRVVRRVLQALTSQQYSLQALAALFLMISAFLLQLGSREQEQHPRAGETGMTNSTGSEGLANSSKTSQSLLLPILPETTSFTSILLCLNVLTPMILHSMAESDPIWQREKLWGVCYSALLVFTSVKYVSSSLLFQVLSVAAALSPHQLVLFESSLWIPILYALSLLSLFMFCVSLKIYVELSCPGLPPAGGPTLRRKARPCPSPLAVLLTTALQVGWEVPLMTELYFLFLKTSHAKLLALWAFHLGFCLVCSCVCLMLCLRHSYRAHRARAKKGHYDSGLCLAHSFVYQTRKHEDGTKC